MKIKGFPKNVQIRYIGKIFKHNHLKSWNLELCVKESETNILKHTRLSNLPALAKRRYINPNDGQARKGGYSMNLDGISTSNWQKGFDSESDGTTFVFDYHSNHSPRIKVHLPQIELARILFFHNAYLARNCIDNGILSREFWIKETAGNPILINVLPICTLPLKTFNNEGERRLLAWILLDDNARISYESIAKYYNEESIENDGRKSWHFRFKPPQLDNLSLKTKGWFDKETKNYYVHEITSISNVQSSLSEKVYFYSDRFKVGAQVGSKGGSAGGAGLTDSDSIDDQHDANIDTKIKILDIPKTLFSFASTIETRKVVKRKSKGRTGTDAETTDEFVELEFSADEAIVGGTACQADFAGLEDESDVIELYMQRFEAFKLLIKKLSEQPNVECHEELHFLPSVGRSRLHRTIDGNKRSILEVKVKTDAAQFVILEIDTSDNSKPVSTLVIKINDIDYWNAQINELLRSIVKRSLLWPKAISLKKFGEVSKLNHPQGLFEFTESSEEVMRWEKRLSEALRLAG